MRRAAVKAARREIHVTLKQANYDYERIQYNTVVSAGNEDAERARGRAGRCRRRAARCRAKACRSCCACCIRSSRTSTWALWNDLGFARQYGDLLDAPWPQVDAAALAQDEIELMLQINGKLRGKLRVPAGADAAAIEAAARASAEVAKHAAGAPVKKVIVVPGRLVNVVV